MSDDSPLSYQPTPRLVPPPPPAPVRYPDPSAPEARAALVAHFHALIAETAARYRLPVPDALPDPYVPDEQGGWFPVPGMYGGFAYAWQDAHTLEARSWSRVVGGSGQRHLITAERAVLVEEGFV